ncbi:MAG: hypothetical protein V1729_05640 [Candidatus Woesearchaeota archaeon]
MLAKGKKSTLYRTCSLLLLGALASVNYVIYSTHWRQYRTEPVTMGKDHGLASVVGTAEGDSIKEKLSSVVNEKIWFREDYSSDTFRAGLFVTLAGKGKTVMGQELTLEEKINLAQEFSSELKYNGTANFISHVSDSEGIVDAIKRSVESVNEFVKINIMDSEEVVRYKNVICLQYATVFADALYEIDKASTNPVNPVIGTIIYAPNSKENHGNFFDTALSIVNSTLFSEWISSVPHAINIIATDEAIHIIEPQGTSSYKYVKLDINKEYSPELK